MKTSFPEPSDLLELAQRDPEALEQLRLREIQQLIDGAPEHLKARLKGLQFQIDCKRRLHKTPLGSCIAISTMMLDSLHSLNDALQGRESLQQDRSSPRGSVIEFPHQFATQMRSRDKAP